MTTVTVSAMRKASSSLKLVVNMLHQGPSLLMSFSLEICLPSTLPSIHVTHSLPPSLEASRGHFVASCFSIRFRRGNDPSVATAALRTASSSVGWNQFRLFWRSYPRIAIVQSRWNDRRRVALPRMVRAFPAGMLPHRRSVTSGDRSDSTTSNISRT